MSEHFVTVVMRVSEEHAQWLRDEIPDNVFLAIQRPGDYDPVAYMEPIDLKIGSLPDASEPTYILPPELIENHGDIYVRATGDPYCGDYAAFNF